MPASKNSASPDREVCVTCGNRYPRTDKHWFRNRRSADGFIRECKQCNGIRANKWRSENKERVRETDRIYREENREKRREYDRAWSERNQALKKLYRRRWFEKNRERAYLQTKQWRANNPEKARAMIRRWRTQNSEHIKAYKKLYRSLHKTEEAEQQKRWRNSNREKKRQIDRNRRARKAGAEGFFTGVEVKRLYQSQEGRCFHCGCNLEETGFERDHWIPLDKGGSNWIENIRLLCPFCNRSKHNRLPWEWAPDKYTAWSGGNYNSKSEG